MWTLRNSQGDLFNFDYIEEGFTSKIEFASYSIDTEGGLVEFFDDGAVYDKISAIFTAIFDQAKLTELENFYNIDRDGDFTLLTNGARGFSLFSPAFGDEGDFLFKIKSLQQTGALNSSKYKHFRVRFEVLAISPLPSYTAPLTGDEGKIQIANVTGIRYPVSGFNPSVSFDVGAESTALGVAYSNDWKEQNERSKFTLRLLQPKMARLLQSLRVFRYSEMDLVVPSEVYPFGAKQGLFSTFKVRMLNKSLVVKHIKNKRYELSLELQRLSSE